MFPAHVVTIETPTKVLLNGLWFGPEKAKSAIIWVHGLNSSAFSKAHIAHELSGADTAVLTFNNRGHDKVTRIVRGEKKILAGGAHEVFTECVDDIQGAVDFAKKRGAKEIFLAGHSTGSQKIAYYASKKPDRAVRGLILMVPLSDYAGMKKEMSPAVLARAEKAARQFVRAKKPHELLPRAVWPLVDDAQRFLSLYTPDSIEQSIFSYFDAKRTPKIFRSLKLPMLAIFAGADEYADRPAHDIVSWFTREARGSLRAVIIPDASHGFQGKEQIVARNIANWIARR